MISMDVYIGRTTWINSNNNKGESMDEKTFDHHLNQQLLVMILMTIFTVFARHTSFLRRLGVNFHN